MDAAKRLADTDAIERLWARDASLFSADESVQDLVANRLGWLGLGGAAGPLVKDILALAADVLGDGIADVVLLGMGGSSLAPLVMSRVLPARDGGATLHVLDTSSPAAVEAAWKQIDPARAVFVVASKSGGTIEPNSLYAVFRERMDEALGHEEAGRHFMATTDPGSSLQERARSEGFRLVLSTPPDVGGRYSALTAFGLAPTALLGGDIATLTGRAAGMEHACRKPVPENPGARLASWMIDAADAGRDKLTLVTSIGLDSFGIWAEQLIAESTGKRGKGVIPVPEHTVTIPTGFGDDRAVAVVRWAEDGDLAAWAQAVAEEAPVIELVLDDPFDLGAEFVRWEFATALAGVLMGINPFDEPNVTEAKLNTSAILEGESNAPVLATRVPGASLYYGNVTAPEAPGDLATALAPLGDALEPDDYLVALCYVHDEEILDPVRTAFKTISERTGNATVVQMGPRYLHSTGQLHKGGPNTGVFLVVTTDGQPRVPVPGSGFDLAELYAAQAEGDAATLQAHDRRVVLVELADAADETLASLALALERAL